MKEIQHEQTDKRNVKFNVSGVWECKGVGNCKCKRSYQDAWNSFYFKVGIGIGAVLMIIILVMVGA